MSSGKVVLFTAVIFAYLYLSRDSILNQPAPEFSLPEDYGGTVDLASYRGRPVLLIFWTTSCGYCRQELPLVSRLAPEFRRKGITVLAVNLGGGSAREYIRSNGIHVTSLVDGDGAVGHSYHVGSVPKLVLIDGGGKVVRVSNGAAGEDQLRAWMDAVSAS